MNEHAKTRLAALLMKGLSVDEMNELTSLLMEEREEYHKTKVKNLGLFDVRQQSELLKAFKEWERWDYKKPYDTPTDEIVKDYISLL